LYCLENHEVLDGMGKRGNKFIVDNFSWKEISEKIYSLYKN